MRLANHHPAPMSAIRHGHSIPARSIFTFFALVLMLSATLGSGPAFAEGPRSIGEILGATPATDKSTEILRGAIQAVPFGEVEAGRAFGMSRALILRRVILPRAFRIGLPAYTNEVIFLFQATSLVSIITIMDLTGVGRVLIAESFRTFEIWIFVGLCYLVMSYGILYGFKRLEYRLSGHLRAGPAVAAAPAEEALAIR